MALPLGELSPKVTERALEALPIKWYAPIASVAALTAQPLAALPPYGCGVPFTGSERLRQLRVLQW